MRPDLKKGFWKEEEDRIIFELYNRAGPKWSFIAKHLKGRSDNAIKNRFHSTLRRMQNKTKKEQQAQDFQALMNSDIQIK